MIRSAYFRNYRSLRDVKLSLEPLTVIVGPNSSGKTSILQGLQAISGCGLNHPSVLYRGLDHPVLARSAGTRDPLVLAIEGDWDRLPGRLQLTFSEGADNVGGGWRLDISD